MLVVDDDASVRRFLEMLLSEAGYAVALAGDGEEAVGMCRERPFDLVLMDVRMPKKSGFDALLEIQAVNPAIPVLMMTAYS